MLFIPKRFPASSHLSRCMHSNPLQLSNARRLVKLGWNRAWLAVSMGLFLTMPLQAMLPTTWQVKDNAPPSSNASQDDNKQLQQQVNDLVSRLDAEQLADRDAAEQAILELGAKVIPLLPKVTPNTAAETELRLKRLIEKLESQSMEVSTEASIVTLQGTMTIADALQSIMKQSGNTIAYASVPDKKVELDIDDATFWEALDEVLDAGELDLNLYSIGDGKVDVKARDPKVLLRQLRAAYCGPFRVEPTEVTAIKSLVDPKQNLLRVRAVVEWEPKMRPIYLQIPMEKVELMLSDDSTLAATMPQSAPEYTTAEGTKSVEIEFSSSTSLQERSNPLPG